MLISFTLIKVFGIFVRFNKERTEINGGRAEGKLLIENLPNLIIF